MRHAEKQPVHFHQPTAENTRRDSAAQARTADTTQLAAIVNSSQRMSSLGNVVAKIDSSPRQQIAQRAAADIGKHSSTSATGRNEVVQRAVATVEEFDASTNYDEIDQKPWLEAWAHLRMVIEQWNEYDYDVNDMYSDKFRGVYNFRQEQILRIRSACESVIGPRGGTKERQLKEIGRWEAMDIIYKNVVSEHELYYKEKEAGMRRLTSGLLQQQQQYRKKVYSADEFAEGAGLSFLTSRTGGMGDVVTKLKAFHAINEVPGKDSTRQAKLEALDELMARAIEVKKSQSDEAGNYGKSPKDPVYGKIMQWYITRVNALNNLIEMLKNNRGRYAKPQDWQQDIDDAHTRTENAAIGVGADSTISDDGEWVDVQENIAPKVSTTEAAGDDWVEVHDGPVSKNEEKAKTEAILECLESQEMPDEELEMQDAEVGRHGDDEWGPPGSYQSNARL